MPREHRKAKVATENERKTRLGFSIICRRNLRIRYDEGHVFSGLTRTVTESQVKYEKEKTILAQKGRT